MYHRQTKCNDFNFQGIQIALVYFLIFFKYDNIIFSMIISMLCIDRILTIHKAKSSKIDLNNLKYLRNLINSSKFYTNFLWFAKKVFRNLQEMWYIFSMLGSKKSLNILKITDKFSDNKFSANMLHMASVASRYCATI